MSANNKIVWTEGMFMRPQHFQQSDRYHEKYAEHLSVKLHPYHWGFNELEIDTELLLQGKFALLNCSGVFPDGTPFNIPAEDVLPPPLDIPDDTKTTEIFLAIPLRRSNELEVHQVDDDQHARYQSAAVDVKDVASDQGEMETVVIGRLSPRLLLAEQCTTDYSALGVGFIIECKADKQLLLNEGYIAPTINCLGVSRIKSVLNEIVGLINHQIDKLAGRVTTSGKGTSELADFLLLQTLNRNAPLWEHYANTRLTHPVILYQSLIQLIGELVTFSHEQKSGLQLPAYRHDALHPVFDTLMTILREHLTQIGDTAAIPIELKKRQFGIYLATINDDKLLKNASFVLAVTAQVSTEKVRNLTPKLMKIAPVESIRQIINSQLPAIGLSPLPVAPRQIPFHSSAVYFDIDTDCALWQEVKAGFAVHVAAELPIIELELWAINR